MIPGFQEDPAPFFHPSVKTNRRLPATNPEQAFPAEPRFRISASPASSEARRLGHRRRRRFSKAGRAQTCCSCRTRNTELSSGPGPKSRSSVWRNTSFPEGLVKDFWTRTRAWRMTWSGERARRRRASERSASTCSPTWVWIQVKILRPLDTTTPYQHVWKQNSSATRVMKNKVTERRSIKNVYVIKLYHVAKLVS